MSKQKIVLLTSLVIPIFAITEYWVMSCLDVLTDYLFLNILSVAILSIYVGQAFYGGISETIKIEKKEFKACLIIFFIMSCFSMLMEIGISKGYLSTKNWGIVMISCPLISPFLVFLVSVLRKRIIRFRNLATSLLLMTLTFVCTNSFAAKSLEAVAKSAEQKTSSLALALAPVGLIISAFFFFLGKEDGKQKAAMALMGTVIVVSAGSVVSWVKALF